MKYMVVMDGCDGYGSIIYFVGLFDDKDSAKKVIEECVDHLEHKNLPRFHNRFKIIEVDENKVHYPDKTYPDSKYLRDVCTDIYLGGYEK